MKIVRRKHFEWNNGGVAKFPDDCQCETDSWLPGSGYHGVFPVIVSAGECREYTGGTVRHSCGVVAFRSFFAA